MQNTVCVFLENPVKCTTVQKFGVRKIKKKKTYVKTILWNILAI